MGKSIIEHGGGGASKPYEANFLANNWTFVRDTSRDNYWYWERFSSITADVNSLNVLANMNPAATNYYSDSSLSISMNITDSYTARCTIYIMCPAAVTMTLTCTTDDNGYIWLNDNPVTNLASCTDKSVTFDFIQGVNKLVFVYTEGGGGDGWRTNPHLVTKVGSEFSWICGSGTWEQTVSLSPTPNTTGLVILKTIPESASDEKNKNILYQSPLHINSDKTITTSLTNKPTANTKIYFNESLSPINTQSVHLLYGGISTWTTSTITLNDDYTNYDLICFIYSHSGENASVALASSYVDSKIYPASFLKAMQDNNTGAIALFGYSTRFVKYQITNERTFTWIRNGDSGTTGVIAIYGIVLR